VNIIFSSLPLLTRESNPTQMLIMMPKWIKKSFYKHPVQSQFSPLSCYCIWIVW